MFDCPQCHTPVSKSKAFFLNKSSRIRCEHCKTMLKPKEATIKRIGMIGGGAGAALGVMALKTMGLLGVIIVIVVGMVVVTVITINITEFEAVES